MKRYRKLTAILGFAGLFMGLIACNASDSEELSASGDKSKGEKINSANCPKEVGCKFTVTLDKRAKGFPTATAKGIALPVVAIPDQILITQDLPKEPGECIEFEIPYGVEGETVDLQVTSINPDGYIIGGQACKYRGSAKRDSANVARGEKLLVNITKVINQYEAEGFTELYATKTLVTVKSQKALAVGMIVLAQLIDGSTFIMPNEEESFDHVNVKVLNILREAVDKKVGDTIQVTLIPETDFANTAFAEYTYKPDAIGSYKGNIVRVTNAASLVGKSVQVTICSSEKMPTILEDKKEIIFHEPIGAVLLGTACPKK